MPQINRNKFTAEENKRYSAVFNRLLSIIFSAEPSASEFKLELDAARAGGFPIKQNPCGHTLLLAAVNTPTAVDAGLPQLLVEAGAEVDAQTDNDETPLGRACVFYICFGRSEYLAVIHALLETGAKPELDEEWKKLDWTKPGHLARRDQLEAYIKSWTVRRRDGDVSPVFEYAM